MVKNGWFGCSATHLTQFVALTSCPTIIEAIYGKLVPQTDLLRLLAAEASRASVAQGIPFTRFTDSDLSFCAVELPPVILRAGS